MLVITRNPAQSFRIGTCVKVRIIKVQGYKVTIGIEAPKNIGIVRENAKVKTRKYV